MAGPWEQYQSTATESGPWSKYAAAPQSLVDQIPDTPAPVSTKPTPKSGVGEKVLGGLETVAALGTGAVTSAVAPLVGLYGDLTSGNVADRAASQRVGMRKAGEFVDQYTYAPRSETGQAATRTIGNAMASAIGATPVLNQFAPLAGRMRQGVGQVVGETVGTVKDMTKVPEAITSSRAIQASDKAWGNAPVIDAAKDAVRLGLAVDPSITNPTTPNRMKGVLVGPTMTRAAEYKTNTQRLAEIARNEIGLGADDALDTAGFNKAMTQATSGSYNEIRALPELKPTPDIKTTLDALRPDPRIVSEKATRDRLNALIDDAMEKIQNGQDGASALKNIQQFRSEANDAFAAAKKGPITPIELSVAKAKLGLANAFETLIEDNLPLSSDLISRYRADRALVAKIGTYKTATNVGQGKIDPMTLAAMTEADNALTGDIAAASRVINNFPASFTKPPPVTAEGMLRRYGPGGIIGGAVGSMVGSLPAGVVIGATAGKLASSMMANRMASRAYQAKHALPDDPRLPRNAMAQ